MIEIDLKHKDETISVKNMLIYLVIFSIIIYGLRFIDYI